MTTEQIDMDRLLKLRIVVARFGEMDLARWWNTNKQLAQIGASVLKRGFPRTHYFAQARSVFAVAARRCEETYDMPGAITLWRLPQNIEEEFDARWEHWLDNASEWTPFFASVAAIQSTDLAAHLKASCLVTEEDLSRYSKLKRSAEGRSVSLPGTFDSSDSDVALLALGFARSEVGALAVPHMSLQ